MNSRKCLFNLFGIPVGQPNRFHGSNAFRGRTHEPGHAVGAFLVEPAFLENGSDHSPASLALADTDAKSNLQSYFVRTTDALVALGVPDQPASSRAAASPNRMPTCSGDGIR